MTITFEIGCLQARTSKLTVYMISSILTYVVFGVLMFILGSLAQKGLLQKRMKNYFPFILMLITFSIICGVRYRVGTDCESYADIYKQLSETGRYIPLGTDRDLEPLFFYLCKAIASIDSGRVIFLSFWAFVEIVFFYLAFKERSYLFGFLGLTLVLGPHYLIWMNTVRQCIAANIFVYALVVVINGKGIVPYVKYISLIFIASLIHHSAVILFPFFLLKKVNFLPSWWVCLLILLLGAVLGQNSIVANYLGQGQFIMAALGYDSYSVAYESFMEMDAMVTNFGPRRIVILLTEVLIIIYSKKIDRFYNSDRIWRVSFLLFVIYAPLSNLLISMSQIFTRPILYLMPFELICTAYLLYYLYTKKNLVIVLAITTSCTYNILVSILEAKEYMESGLFKFIFFQ